MARPVPPSFRCPISLEVMKDPVTLSTGHTYDRANIEKWLKAGHKTCPVTMMPLQDASLIPNVIVRRLIQAWCADNGWKRSFKGENIVTSNSADTRDCVLSFLKEIARGQSVQSAVRGLKQLAKQSEENQQCIVGTGGPLLLVSLLWVNASDLVHEDCEACEDALSVLALLCQNSSETKCLVMESPKLSWIIWHLQYSFPGAKLAAARLLRTLFKEDDSREIIGKAKGVFEGLVSLLADNSLNSKAHKLVVKVMWCACESRENQLKVVEAGAVAVLVSLLRRCQKAGIERVLATLELLCATVEGKDAASRLPDFFPVLIEKMVRVSDLSTEYATACVLEVCSSNKVETLYLALEAGIYPQLLLVLQSGGTARVKCKVQELLKRLHSTRAQCHL
ncbi:hypothetical protein L7F22_054309 [Adiantum nelumboides]|nr:hypothetical protein [Adiantum nelumboides]